MMLVYIVQAVASTVEQRDGASSSSSFLPPQMESSKLLHKNKA